MSRAIAYTPSQLPKEGFGRRDAEGVNINARRRHSFAWRLEVASNQATFTGGARALGFIRCRHYSTPGRLSCGSIRGQHEISLIIPLLAKPRKCGGRHTKWRFEFTIHGPPR